MSLRLRFGQLNPYDIHKLLINEYILTKKGTTNALKRDTSKDKTDKDTIRENLRFIWDEEKDPVDTWEKKLAKRYYDKLYKEYCIGDLSLYKENKVGLRWRTEAELISGKGQFSCGAKSCDRNEDLRSWEVNFKYIEFGEQKNALVKIRLCPKCSKRLNYHWKRKEVKRVKDGLSIPREKEGTSKEKQVAVQEKDPGSSKEPEVAKKQEIQDAWKETGNQIQCVEEKTKDDQLDEFLQDLFM